MYHRMENPRPGELKRMYIGRGAKLDTGPPKEKDIVTVRADEDVEFYIELEETDDDNVRGAIVGIGPESQYEYEGWHHGNLIEVPEPSITAII